MSEASNNVGRAIDATVDAVAAPSEAAAVVARAVEKSARKAEKSATKAAGMARAAATPKRTYKPRVKSVAASAAHPARKRNTKAADASVRRQYHRKPAAAATAFQFKGLPIMTNEFPNVFAGFNAVPGADKFQSLFADAGEKSQDAVRKGRVFAEQLTEAAKANVEAVVESSRIAFAGARDLGQDVAASTRGGVEQASAAVKTLAEAKSPTEFFQLHSELVRSSFDRFVAEGSKFTEQLVKLTGEAIQPLSNRASVNAEAFSELTA
ncbi:MAG: phasin family protein [Sphingomicrobium sp.]|nr:phasin family protein [Sphingomonadales bacterium]